MTARRLFLVVLLRLPEWCEMDCHSAVTPSALIITETAESGREFGELQAEMGMEWTLNYQPGYNKHSEQLHDFYKSAFSLTPSYKGNTMKCRVEQGESSCKLVLVKQMDAELIGKLADPKSKAEDSLKASYSLMCRAMKSGALFGKPVIPVRVLSINEFAPEFDVALSNIEIPENSLLDTVVVDLKPFVRDRDYGIGDSVQSIVLENKTDLIVLNGTRIVLKKQLNYDEQYDKKQTLLTFKLEAVDSEGLANTGQLVINLTDIDTHPPYFISLGCRRLTPCVLGAYKGYVTDSYEGVVEDIRPSQILAADGDIGQNVTIKYCIDNDTVDEYVEINEDTGQVFIKKPLEKFSETSIRLIVVATEDTYLSRTANATLLVKVRPHPSSNVLVLAASIPAAALTVFAAFGFWLYRRWKRRPRDWEDKPGEPIVIRLADLPTPKSKSIHSPEVTEDASAYDDATIFSSESDHNESIASGENQSSLFSINQPVNTAFPPEANDSVVLNDN